MIKIYKIIKQKRECKKITQEEIAKKIKISRNTYINFEKGEKDLTLQQLEKIAGILDFDLISLLENKEEKRKKYKEMLLYFLRLLDGDKKIPKTKLAKLLYLADFVNYYYNLKSMSGLKYRKIQFGPVPDDYFVILEELSDNGDIKIEPKNKTLLISQTRVAERNILEKLSEEEKKIMKKIFKKWKDSNTEEIVKFSHKQIPYEFADNNDIIPYNLILQEEEKNVF